MEGGEGWREVRDRGREVRDGGREVREGGRWREAGFNSIIVQCNSPPHLPSQCLE